jgi:hypothetical protein
MYQAKGIITALLPEITGTSQRGDWSKRDFVIQESEGQYPKSICFTSFNDKSDLFNRVKVGSEVNVSFNIESKEYNGKYFTNLTSFKVELVGVQQAPPPFDSRTPITNEGDDQDLPF